MACPFQLLVHGDAEIARREVFLLNTFLSEHVSEHVTKHLDASFLRLDDAMAVVDLEHDVHCGIAAEKEPVSP